MVNDVDFTEISFASYNENEDRTCPAILFANPAA